LPFVGAGKSERSAHWLDAWMDGKKEGWREDGWRNGGRDRWADVDAVLSARLIHSHVSCLLIASHPPLIKPAAFKIISCLQYALFIFSLLICSAAYSFEPHES